jgi:hypothetical protein
LGRPGVGHSLHQTRSPCYGTKIEPTELGTVLLDNQEVRRLIVEEMAYIRGCHAAEVEAEIDASGGDLEVDSKLGQVVAVRVAIRLGREGLIRPEDQRREHLTSVLSLEQLVVRRLAG